MSYKIVISSETIADLNNAADYIDYSLKNRDAANRLIDSFEDTILSLADYPERHPVLDDPYFAAYGIRCIEIGNYLAFYNVDNASQEVSIIRFLYKRRDWIAILSKYSSLNTDSNRVHEKLTNY